MIVIDYVALILIAVVSLVISVYLDITISHDKPVITSLVTTVIVAIIVHFAMS